MGTLGETTSKRLAAVVRQVGNQGGHNVHGLAGVKYHGGYAGGSGTWGRAPTGRGDASEQPLAALQGNLPVTPHTGRRTRVRSNAEGSRNAWDTLPEKALPKAPAKGGRPMTCTSRRPSAQGPETMRKTGSVVALQQYAYTSAGLLKSPEAAASAGRATRPCSAHTFSGQNASSLSPDAPSMRPRAGPDAIMSSLSVGKACSAVASVLPSAMHGIEARSDSGSGAPMHDENDIQVTRDREQGCLELPSNIAAVAAQLVDKLRKALKKARTVYEGERMLLEKACLSLDDGSGQFDAATCAEVFTRVGVRSSTAEVAAFIQRHSSNPGYISSATLHALLLTDRSRLLATELPHRKGAFSARDSACGTKACKIVYPQCKTPVYTPTGWGEMGSGDACITHSMAVPEHRLQLEFVYGYEGANNTSSNVFYNCQRQVVYYTAALAIVYTPPADTADDALAAGAHTQHFFLGHDDDIKALAPCPASINVGEQQYPAHSLFASGQVTTTSHGPCVCIWDSRVSSVTGQPELRRVQMGKDARGVCALAFSPDGSRLVVVTMDNAHSVFVYDWRTGRIVSTGRGFAGEPPQVYGVTWNPFLLETRQAEFLTWGRKHCKLWTQPPPAQGGRPPVHAGWTPFQLSFGSYDLQNVHSAVFLPISHAVVLGLARGELLVIERGQAVRSIPAHRPGPQAVVADGSITYNGVRGMALHRNNAELLTAGADGVIHVWDIKDGTLSADRELRSITLTSAYGLSGKAPTVRALAVCPTDEDVILGTSACDIIEVNERNQAVLVFGQAGALHAVAWHPVRQSVFVTACEAPRVFVCDAACRDVIKTAPLGFAARACAWSPVPLGSDHSHHLCLGAANGKLVVLDEETLRVRWEGRDSHHGICDLKYNPAGNALAAATMDRHIDVYRTAGARYTRLARCRGHSSVVRHLDWSADGSVLQSMCSAYEMLHWHGHNGKQLTAGQRDIDWATWTCILGFPVMGIWPADSDGTDVNAVDRHPGGKLLATADDSGTVKLFNYPCVVDDAPHRAYCGHSAHVTGLRFSADGSRLVSVGGADRSVFQFLVVSVQPAAPPAPPKNPEWGTVDGKVYGWTRCLTPHLEADGAGQSEDVGEERLSKACNTRRSSTERQSGEGSKVLNGHEMAGTGGW